MYMARCVDLLTSHGPLSSSHLLAIVKNAAMSTGVQADAIILKFPPNFLAI